MLPAFWAWYISVVLLDIKDSHLSFHILKQISFSPSSIQILLIFFVNIIITSAQNKFESSKSSSSIIMSSSLFSHIIRRLCLLQSLTSGDLVWRWHFIAVVFFCILQIQKKAAEKAQEGYLDSDPIHRWWIRPSTSVAFWRKYKYFW